MTQLRVLSTTPTHRLVRAGDALTWVLLTRPVADCVLELRQVDCATRYLVVYEAWYGSAQVGWAYTCTVPNYAATPNSLMVYNTAFRNMTPRTLRELDLDFVLQYKMADWQYLTCGHVCSMILAVPPPETCERFEP